MEEILRGPPIKKGPSYYIEGQRDLTERIGEWIGYSFIGLLGLWSMYCGRLSKKSLKNNVINERK